MKYDRGDQLIELSLGMFVERDVMEVVDRIRAYDPNLDVLFLDPNVASDISDAPYMIVERVGDVIKPVFQTWTLDNAAYERVVLADNKRFDIQAALETANAAAREAPKKAFKEEGEESKDILAHVVATPKGRYSIPTPTGDVVTIDDHLGVVKRESRGDS